MNPSDMIAHLAALWLGIFAGMLGLAFWIAGFANPRTNSMRQTIYAATCVTAAILLLAFAFSGHLPY